MSQKIHILHQNYIKKKRVRGVGRKNFVTYWKKLNELFHPHGSLTCVVKYTIVLVKALENSSNRIFARERERAKAHLLSELETERHDFHSVVSVGKNYFLKNRQN